MGDAVGTALEFELPRSFVPITDMIGGGPFGLAPGQWTDDTSMALCLAESLLEKQGFDAVDQLERYGRWWKEGHLSSTGKSFDIGIATREALSLFVKTPKPFCGSTDPKTAGNGSIMRLAPIPTFFAGDPERAIELAADSSRTTHSAPAAVDACRYFAARRKETRHNPKTRTRRRAGARKENFIAAYKTIRRCPKARYPCSIGKL